MPTRKWVVSNVQWILVRSLVRSGRYQNASEVFREGLRLIERREAEYVARLDALRAAVSEGITALEKGTFTEFSDAGSMSRYLDGLSDRSTSGASKRH